jgi:fumarylacetoacetase
MRYGLRKKTATIPAVRCEKKPARCEEPDMYAIDETHDPARRSWVASAQGHAEFPIQNLPVGVFSPSGGGPRGGVAIGECILDLGAALDADCFSGEARHAAQVARGTSLNDFLALGSEQRSALRRQISDLLWTDGARRARAESLASRLLHEARACTLHLPAKIGAYTDFYAGIEHAANGGRRRGQNPPLAPNYKYVPVAYHSRASSVRPSGTPIRRPNGQRLAGSDEEPTFGPCLKLDFELELGIWIGAGNAWGEPIPIGRAHEQVAGLCLLNDWSARDIQRWEMAPLGPFLCKNFGTTVSPWIVTAEALAPYRVAQAPRPQGDPAPLPYLWDDTDQSTGAFDIELEVRLSTQTMQEQGMAPVRIALSNTRHLYWTVAQMVAHHTCGGCDLAPGDIFGSGTISAPDASGFGSIAELSFDGTRPFTLPSGETRAFLEDGDEVTPRAHAHRSGYVSIGFGECIGRIIA